MVTFMQTNPMTKSGEKKIRDEIQRLKDIERPRIKTMIAEARAHGDLKENAEYHAAKELQGMNEAKISAFEAKLKSAQIIDITQFKNEGKVIFGATITLENLENNKTMTFQIVGENESDINQQKLSFAAPLSRAVIGKFCGDFVEASTPNGIIEYEIIAVDYI
jgi:transcription elongation factor GreA